MSALINKPVVKLAEKPIPHTQNIKQPEITLKVPIPKNSSSHDKIIPIPYYTIPQTRSGDNSSSGTVKRKTMQDIGKEIPMYPDPIYGSLLNQQKYPHKNS